MPFGFKTPKLKDKIYGELSWEDWDENEAYWYASMEDKSGNSYSLLISADSQLDFWAVRSSHPTFLKIHENLNSIRDEMIYEILENSRRLFKKKRQRDSAGETFKKKLKLFSIKIYSDQTSQVDFVGNFAENGDPDESFYAVLDQEGNLVDVGIEEY
jgi:hypothetical protein